MLHPPQLVYRLWWVATSKSQIFPYKDSAVTQCRLKAESRLNKTKADDAVSFINAAKDDADSLICNDTDFSFT